MKFSHNIHHLQIKDGKASEIMCCYCQSRWASNSFLCTEVWLTVIYQEICSVFDLLLKRFPFPPVSIPSTIILCTQMVWNYCNLVQRNSIKIPLQCVPGTLSHMRVQEKEQTERWFTHHLVLLSWPVRRDLWFDCTAVMSGLPNFQSFGNNVAAAAACL